MESDITKYNYLFIGGLTSSGTTVVYNCLTKAIINSKTTKPYQEGQFDPNHPDFLGKKYTIQENFTNNQTKKIIQWISSYNPKNSNIFIEKSPRHFACFVGLQNIFPNSYFICMQREPYQCLASALSRWNSKQDLIEKRLISMIKFHNIYSKKLNNFSYVKYEKFCKQPVSTVNDTLKSLGINNYNNEKLMQICNKLSIKKPKIHQRPKFNSRISKLCDKLCKLWRYDV